MSRACSGVALVLCLLALPAAGQTPAPFPSPGAPRPAPDAQAPAPPASPAGRPSATAQGEPTGDTLGIPVYPGAQFLTSYDAGKGQRYYLFGTNTPYSDIVTYYRSVLRQRGDQVYDEPPIHMFDVGRFREQTMAFPPGVTVKDYTWGGSKGFLNPRKGAEPSRFSTVIQIVPEPR